MKQKENPILQAVIKVADRELPVNYLYNEETTSQDKQERVNRVIQSRLEYIKVFNRNFRKCFYLDDIK